MDKSYIELPKFFSDGVNQETDLNTIVIEQGLDEVGNGKQIGFTSVPITFNINDAFIAGKNLGINALNARGKWELYKSDNPEPVLTHTVSFYGLGGDIPASTAFRINTDSASQDDAVKEPGLYFVNFTFTIPPSQMFSFLPPDPGVEEIYTFEFQMEPDFDDIDELNEKPVFGSFIASIVDVEGTQLTLNNSINEFKEKTRQKESLLFPDVIKNWSIRYKNQDRRDLNTYLHLGDNNLKLITNFTSDLTTIPNSPYSIIYKLYEPLPDDVEEKDLAYVVREMLPELTEVVELVPYEQEDEGTTVLRIPDSSAVDSPVTQRQTEYKNYSDLVTSDARLKKEIEDKFLSGSEKPVELEIDYSNYDNFVNFSSAKKRLENFEYKMNLLQSYTAQSSSLVGVPYATNDVKEFDKLIRNIKSNLDGYETYLYSVSSSYVSSSMGEFPNASWPKTGSGSYAHPYEPLSSSNAQFIDWYGAVNTQKGQIYSASLYDDNNPNRLINLLPEHIRSDLGNKQFLDFMDMVGQHFDELWAYTSELSKVTDRQSDLSKGFSKDLTFNLAKSLGWSTNDGKDLLDLSRVGFGQKVSGSGEYELYTSGSSDSPPEGDISKEITKRLIASMPYLLKTKGTVGSLKGILNCYGIPSSILRVREYGGLQKQNQKDQFEIARKFTRALGFRGGQFVSSSWQDESQTNRKPDTVELRFRSVSGSDQVLVQKSGSYPGSQDWAIKLKDNGSSDNQGTVSFMLSGSDGYKEVSSSLLPIYDGDYYSVMVRKSKINNELWPVGSSSFETPTNAGLFNPPFVTGSNNASFGTLKIVSSSNVARTGGKSLEHKNTRTADDRGISFSRLFQNDSELYPGMTASLASVSEGETYVFSAFAKVSASVVDSVGSVAVFEVDSEGKVINWNDESVYPLQDGGIKTSQQVGLNETEWKQIQVEKKIKFSNTAGLSVRLENRKPNSTIYWDDVSLRKKRSNTDTIGDAFSYDLFVKKYDAGLDRITLSSKTSLSITGSHAATQSYNAAWTGSGDIFIGGNITTPFSASKFTGSIMEFRLWTEPLEERPFDTHVENPKSYIGNTPSSSYYNLARRFSFDDNIALNNLSEILDTSSNQTTTVVGNPNGFSETNTFETVIDKTKTIVPNNGPNRRMATKIRIEDNILSGSEANLNRMKRVDVSSNDFSPIDSPKLGVYFSPVDVVNEDIISSFANLDFNQYIGDPRDNFEQSYSTLRDISNQYFQKYTDNNDFWDFMQLIKYYDQSVFRQLKKLVPARAKTHMGTLIEGNIFERPKSPVQQSNPSITKPNYEDNINISNVSVDETEASQSVISITSEYPNYSGSISDDLFRLPSLYQFSASDNYSDRNLYVNADVKFGNVAKIFTEPTGAMVQDSRLSDTNKEYEFFYTSAENYDKSVKNSTLTGSLATGIDYIDAEYKLNYYSSKSLKVSDRDPQYHLYLPFNRSFYEGVKNTKNTTTDGDLPVIIRISAPTVAVPVDSTTKNLDVIDT